MELSDEIFSEIAGVAVVDPVYELQHERRAHPRVAFGGRARITPLFDTLTHHGVTVMLRDVSRGGIGFLSPQRLDGGDEFVICLRNKSDKLIKIHCIARRCDAGGVAFTQYDIGATFELVLETSAVPDETIGSGEVSASPAPPPEFAPVDPAHCGGPIKRFITRPVTRSAGGALVVYLHLPEQLPSSQADQSGCSEQEAQRGKRAGDECFIAGFARRHLTVYAAGGTHICGYGWGIVPNGIGECAAFNGGVSTESG